MRITVFSENTCCFPGYGSENGLSLFIRTAGHNIVFDFGNDGRFIANAAAMGVDVGRADIAFLSHGHTDHARGMGPFLLANSAAQVYVQSTAFDSLLDAPDGDTDVDAALVGHPRIKLVSGSADIDRELRIFSSIKPKRLVERFLRRSAEGAVVDNFDHEQCLVVDEGGKRTLITGCSHCGIDAIVSQATEKYGRFDTVLGGFHLIEYDFSSPSDKAEIEALGRTLLSFGCMYYTGHCTDVRGYELLKAVMGDSLGHISTGTTIEI